MLQYTTLHYTTPYYCTLHHTALHYTNPCYGTLHNTTQTLHNTTNTLHRTTAHYTTLQYTTRDHATIHYTTQHYKYTSTNRRALPRAPLPSRTGTHASLRCTPCRRAFGTPPGGRLRGHRPNIRARYACVGRGQDRVGWGGGGP